MLDGFLTTREQFTFAISYAVILGIGLAAMASVVTWGVVAVLINLGVI